MTDSVDRTTARRARAEREILDAAWSLMAREGVAALNVREVARSVGIRQQSLTYYFPTKQDLLDALFADGFADLRLVFDQLPPPGDPLEDLIAMGVAFVDHNVAHPARYHLMFQGTIPGFEPSPQSHQIALGVLGELVERLARAGITEPADLALVRSVLSGLAAEQIANDPTGRLFADQTERALRFVIDGLRRDRTPRGAPPQPSR